MKVWVTGAAGQVGFELRSLAGEFPELVMLATDSVTVDITHPDQIARFVELNQPDIIINTAAYTAVDRAEVEPERAFAVNAEAVGYLSAAATEANIPLLHMSTDYVFDGAASHAYTEDDEAGPLGVYGASKRQGELLALACPKCLVLRTSWVFGRHGGNFPKTMLRLAQEASEIRVVHDQRGGPTYAGHLAQALLAMANIYRQSGSLPWGVYHYSGLPATWVDVATVTLSGALTGGLISQTPRIVPIPSSEYPTPAQRPMNSVLDCGRFVAAFPDIPLSNWQVGVENLLTYLGDSGSGSGI